MNRPAGWTTVSVASEEANTPDAVFWVRAIAPDTADSDRHESTSTATTSSA